MPTIETSIWLALKSRVESIGVAYPRAWPGEMFTVPVSGTAPLPYLRIGRVSIAPVGQLIEYGKPLLRTGSLIVTLVYPMAAKVTLTMMEEIAGQIAAHFKDGTQIRYEQACVTIGEYPNVQEGYLDAGYWTVPVVIRWRCFG